MGRRAAGLGKGARTPSAVEASSIEGMVVGAWTAPEQWRSDLAKEGGWSSSEAYCQEADSSLGRVAGGVESP